MSTTLTRDLAGQPLYDRIRKGIENGTLKSGQRLASTKVLQSQMRLSYHATIKALARLTSEGWIVRRNGSGTFVRGVVKNTPEVAQSLTLQLVFYQKSHGTASFHKPLAEGILREAADRNMRVIECDPEALSANNDVSPDLRIWACPHSFHAAPFNALLPTVLAAEDADAISTVEVGGDVIYADSIQGAALAGAHVRKLGCKRLAFIGVRRTGAIDWDPMSAARKFGFQKGLGRLLDQEECFSVGKYTAADGATTCRRLLQGDGVEAVFAASDDIAIGVVHGLLAHGIEVGRQVRVIGFDGQPKRGNFGPALTTVAIPLETIGREAVRLALERRERPQLPYRRVMLACTIREGETA